MASEKAGARNALLLKLGVVALVLIIGAVLVLRGLDVRGLVDQGLGLVREAGAAAFFIGMALLPAAGVPMLAFTIPAVAVFSERFGTIGVVALALVAVTINITLTYALARRGLRPLLSGLMTKLGYKLPQVEEGDATDLIVILRVTPGVPFFIQNYLLGLANVPFGRYLFVSCLISWPLNVAFLLFGDALLQGKGRLALLSISALGALGAITHLVRKHYARKRKEA